MNLGERQARALMGAARTSLYVMTVDTGDDDGTTYYTESPEEQALKDTDPQYYLVRVFTTLEEIYLYRDAVAAIYPKMELNFEKYPDFETLWPRVASMDVTYEQTFHIPVKAVLSEMLDGTWPKTVATIFDPRQFRN
jgi:hypothetical protein